MDNLQSPAYPTIVANDANNKGNAHQIGNYEFQEHGFTKLELASLMAMQGLLSNSIIASSLERLISDHDEGALKIAATSVSFAKAVLEKANK